MFRSFSLMVFCTLLVPCDLLHSQIVVRDSIAPDSSWTDGLGGASAAHDGKVWNTPGMVVDVPETGDLAEVKIVIFAGNGDGNPENLLANILGYPMDFHIWSDGIQGGPDSFFDNAVGFDVPGHTKVEVNTQAASFITVQEFGNTGPKDTPTIFTTFLVTIDLSSFDLELQGAQQYVIGVTHDGFPVANFVTGLGGTFRQIHSLSTGFEDLFQQFDTNPDDLPGFLNRQHEFGADQLAGLVSITSPFEVGDVNQDGVINLLDVDPFIDVLSSGDYQFEADIDGNGVVNLLDVDPFIVLLSGG